MHVRGDKLVSYSLLLLCWLLVLFATFIVHYPEVHEKVSVLEMLHDDVVAFQTIGVLPGLEGLDQDHVGGVVGDHDIVVPAPSSGSKALCIICVELSLVNGVHMQAMGAVIWWWGFDIFIWRCSVGKKTSTMGLLESWLLRRGMPQSCQGWRPQSHRD